VKGMYVRDFFMAATIKYFLLTTRKQFKMRQCTSLFVLSYILSRIFFLFVLWCDKYTIAIKMTKITHFYFMYARRLDIYVHFVIDQRRLYLIRQTVRCTQSQEEFD